MRHVEKALKKFTDQMEVPTGADKFIEIENAEDKRGVAPAVKFTIQSGPISEVGVNGCQAQDMLIYVKCLFESLNEAFPCEENVETIFSIEDAIEHQETRTNNRINRGVEGKNKA